MGWRENERRRNFGVVARTGERTVLEEAEETIDIYFSFSLVGVSCDAESFFPSCFLKYTVSGNLRPTLSVAVAELAAGLTSLQPLPLGACRNLKLCLAALSGTWRRPGPQIYLCQA